MKIIYTIYLSEDGLFNEAYSNKKALFNAIESNTDLQTYNDCRTIETFIRKDGDLKFVNKPFNYSNLVKALNTSDHININDGSFNSSVIRIQAIQLLSK